MIHVALTGLTAEDAAVSSLQVARCIKDHPEFKGKIIALAYDAFEPELLDPALIDAAYLLPYPKAGLGALLERIRSIHQRERIDVLIPNVSGEMLKFIGIQKELEAMGIIVLAPSLEQLHAGAKSNLPEFGKIAGVPVPETVLVSDSSEPALEKMRYPVIVKGLFYEAYLAYSFSEAAHYVNKVAAVWQYPVVVQTYIRGQHFGVIALGDGSGETTSMLCRRKQMNSDPPGAGPEEPGLLEFIQRILRCLKWRGALEIEVIRSIEDGQLYLIRLNPQIPGWIAQGREAGANFAYDYLQLALSQGLQGPIGDRVYFHTGVFSV